MTHAVLWQNAFAEIERNPAGQPIALYSRLPWLTKPIRQNGILAFETTDTPNGVKRIIKSEDMIHVIGFSTDGILGRSLVNVARQTVGIAMAATKYGARFFANNARPGGVLELEHPLSPEDMTRLRQDVEAMSSGTNTHRVAVLPQGIKWAKVAIDPVQAQYIETEKFTVGEIAAMFRVPGYMVGALEKVLKSTVEAQNSEFLSYSLRPWLNRIEQEVERKLLPPVGRNSGKYTVRFFVDELLRSDYATRIKGYQTGIASGWYSANDVRELLDEPPIEGGDIYYSPLQLVPLSESNEPLDVEDDGEADDGPDTTAARTIFLPLVKDACGRMMARSKKDSTALRTAFLPITAALTTYLNVNTAVPDTYFEAMATRCIDWKADSFEIEYNNLFAVIEAKHE